MKPFIDKRNETKKDLASAKNRLKNFQEQKKKCQTSLNDAVREASEGPADIEGTNEAKRNLDSICLLVDETEKNTIPQLEGELKRSIAELVSNLQTPLGPLKQDYLNRMNLKIKEGLDIGVEYIRFVETTIKELGLNDVIPWFEKERLCSIVPSMGQGLHEGILDIMRLKK